MWLSHLLLMVYLLHTAVFGGILPSTREVQEFEETQDLWKGLFENSMLPGSNNPFTNTPPTNGWLTFLEEHGVGTIDEVYVQYSVHTAFPKSLGIQTKTDQTIWAQSA